MSDWKTLSTRVAYENPFAIMREDAVINPGGQETVYGVLESKSNGVYIIPIDSEGNTYIVQQFRYTYQETVWECPAGRADENDPEAAARRELHEETGLIANKFTHLGTFHTACGISTLSADLFLAEDITQTGDETDQTDGILNVRKLPLSEVITMIMSGEIQCAESVMAFFMAQEHLKQRSLTTY